MKHLDEATILTLRDGEPVDTAVRAHLDVCATCGSALAAAKGRAEDVGRTLSALDRPVEATAAKAGVRARLRPVGRESGTRGWGGRHLSRAAGLLLLTAGAAAALPWTPLWDRWSPPSVAEPVAEPVADADPVVVESEPTPAVAPRPEGAEVGISVAVPDGFIQVVVRGADPGSELSVVWSDERTARVTAPAGSRFTYSAGRVEVDVSRGAITVELARDATVASLEVDGQLYLSGSLAAPEVFGPVVERTDERILFRVDER